MERQITPESLETDIAGSAVQNTRKSHIGHFRGICREFRIRHSSLREILAVIREPDLHALRKSHIISALRHEGSTYVMHRTRFFQVNDYVNVAAESEPPVIAVCPISAESVINRRITARTIFFRIWSQDFHRLAKSKMPHRHSILIPRSEFIVNIERIVAQ